MMVMCGDANQMTPEEFQKFMHARGVHRGQEMNKLEDHIRQSFKVISSQ